MNFLNKKQQIIKVSKKYLLKTYFWGTDKILLNFSSCSLRRDSQAPKNTFSISILKTNILSLLFFSALPSKVFSAGIGDFIDSSYKIVNNRLIPLAFAFCVFYFFWGVAQYIKGLDSEKEVKNSKNIMVWGVVGLFIVFSVWGIIKLIQTEINLPIKENVGFSVNDISFKYY